MIAVRGESAARLTAETDRWLVGTEVLPIVNQTISPSHGNSGAISAQTPLAFPETTLLRRRIRVTRPLDIDS